MVLVVMMVDVVRHWSNLVLMESPVMGKDKGAAGREGIGVRKGKGCRDGWMMGRVGQVWRR